MIRQTPLSRIKYFDILTYEPLIATNTQYKQSTVKKEPEEAIESKQSERNRPPTTSATLFHEKILFFESLSRLGRLIHSSEDITTNNEPERTRNSSCCLTHDSAWSSGSSATNSLNTSFECSSTTIFTNSDIDSDIDTNSIMDANVEFRTNCSPNVREMCLFFEQNRRNNNPCNNYNYNSNRRDFNNNKI